MTGDAPYPVYVIDDERDVRVALVLELRAAGILARPFASGADLLEEVAHLPPGCLLLDIRMPGKNGIELLAELAHRDVRWPTIMMTGHAEVITAVQAMKLGAVDFLEKPFSGEDLMKALHQGFDILDAEARGSKSRREARAACASLTPREQDVLRLVAQGLPNKSVAANLQLSPRTVEMHRSNLMRKLGVTSREELSMIARAAGLAS